MCASAHLIVPVCAQVSPMSGEVQAGQKGVVHLRVCAGIPERLLETLQVELAHFDPINVQVRGVGVQLRVKGTWGARAGDRGAGYGLTGGWDTGDRGAGHGVTGVQGMG